MTGHAIAARLEGELVAIEVIEVGGEYGEVLNTLYIDAGAAIRFGQGLIRLGRASQMGPAADPAFTAIAEVKTRDPHAEDGI